MSNHYYQTRSAEERVARLQKEAETIRLARSGKRSLALAVARALHAWAARLEAKHAPQEQATLVPSTSRT